MTSQAEIALTETDLTHTKPTMLKLIMKKMVQICLKGQSILMQPRDLSQQDINNLEEVVCSAMVAKS